MIHCFLSGRIIHQNIENHASAPVLTSTPAPVSEKPGKLPDKREAARNTIRYRAMMAKTDMKKKGDPKNNPAYEEISRLLQESFQAETQLQNSEQILRSKAEKLVQALLKAGVSFTKQELETIKQGNVPYQHKEETYDVVVRNDNTHILTGVEAKREKQKERYPVNRNQKISPN